MGDEQLAWFEGVNISMDETTSEFLITIDLNGPVGTNNVQSVTQTAAPEEGEDDGAFVPPDIVESTTPSQPGGTTGGGTTGGGSTGGQTVSSTTGGRRGGMFTAAKAAVSLAGALATAGAIGASSGGGGGGEEGIEEEKKKRKTYKMKVYKGFGDGIRKGAKSLKVWARMVEVVEGEEINRPDLSARITVSGTEMTARALGMENTYMAAEVSIPADSEAKTAVLTFSFAGSGGIFRNNIVFKVLDPPEITFPAVTADGRGWDVNSQNNQVDMIAGLPSRERLRFVITNANQEPKAIRFRDHEGYEITWEKDTQWQYTYYACIRNMTAPIEKENGIFASMAPTGAVVEAEFADGLTVWSYIYIRLFPEGLSAQGKLENGRLVVETVPLANPQEGFAKIFPTIFSLTLAYPDSEGHAAVVEGIRACTPKKITDDGKYKLLFSENFKYKLKYPADAQIAIYPENTLPTLGDPYEVYMPISVSTAMTGGRDYSACLPLAVMGEAPKRVYADNVRQAELNLIKKDIKYFGLAGDPSLSTMLHWAARGECSIADLRYIRRRLLEAAVVFYQEQHDAEKRMSELFNDYVVVLGVLQTAGDIAIEVIMSTYWPGYGNITAKFINPFKNILFAYLGEEHGFMADLASEYTSGGSAAKDVDFVEVSLKSLNEAMGSAISLLIAPDIKNVPQIKAMADLKDAAGYIIAVYLLTSYVEHYFGYNGKGKKGEKGDVYRSVIAAFADLGYESLKGFVLGYVKKYCTEHYEKVKNKLGEWFGNALKQMNQERIDAAAQKAGKEAFEKGIYRQFTPVNNSSNYTELRKEVFDKAMDAKAKAMAEVTDQETKKLLEKGLTYSDQFLKGAKETTQNAFYIQTINYFFGGTGPDGTDNSGSDMAELLYGLLTKGYGLIVGNIYEDGGALNPLGVTCRLEGGNIIMGIFGYCVEINILENIFVISELLFKKMFAWMDTFWEACKTAIDSDSIPDRDERAEKSTEKIKQELEWQKRRNESYKWELVRYKPGPDANWKKLV